MNRPTSAPASLEPASGPGATMGRDAIAGFLVFLIALPLCLGIATASGFPAVAGVMTAIVGGALCAHLGSAPLSIKGPAAGLIVIVLGAVTELGAGDPVLGYRRTLAVGLVAAVIQILLAIARAGGIAVVMPPAVVHGMLAAIGVIIVTKQLPVMFGTRAVGSPLEGALHIFDYIAQINPEIFLLGALALLTLIVWPKLPLGRLKRAPAPLVALLLTVPLSIVFELGAPHDYFFSGARFHVGPELLVQLPGNLLDAITLPDLSVITSWTSIKYIMMFALVGSIESLLSVMAVDAMDPKHRASNLDKDLLATGVGNLICACIGGLPMISEIVRSRANIDAGAQSQWANFWHGLYLLLFVALLPGLLQLIPLSVLAAMLVLTGVRLAAPSQLTHMLHKGKDQLAIFVTTCVVTLATDLLIGVLAGLVLKVCFHMLRGASLRLMFRSPARFDRQGDRLIVALHGPVTFLNLWAWIKPFQRELTPEVRVVELDLTHATMIDCTTLERLDTMAKEHAEVTIVWRGESQLHPASSHEHAFRKAR